MRLRAVTQDDRERLLALVRSEEVAASLSVLAVPTLTEAVDRTLARDAHGAALVIEQDDARGPAGVVCWSTRNRRSRIAGIHTLAIDPATRGRGLAVDAVRTLAHWLLRARGFHRVEAEIYGFNTTGVRTFEAAGFTLEGTRRRAYDRHGGWQDGVMFGLLAEDVGVSARPRATGPG